jgi:hypothetical protein
MYILTVVDHFTKFAQAYPIRHHDAQTIAKILCSRYFSIFGIAKSVLTDNGRDFESVLMKELCTALQIDKLRTTFYKPSTNSACERWHRTLNSMLAKCTEKSQKDWDDRVPDVLAAYNGSVHTSTGYSPNFLIFGRENRAPIDLVLGVPKAEEEYFGSADPWVYRQQKIQQEAYALARENLQCHAERTKDFYDIRVKPAEFQVGQWVYMYTPRRRQNLSPKWMLSYEGPYLIVQKMGPVNVRIQKSPRSKSFIVHIDKIKKVLGPTPESWLKEKESGEIRENGGGVVGEERGDPLEQDPLKDEADLSPGCALGENLENLAGTTPPGVPEVTDPVQVREGPPKPSVNIPRNGPAPVLERPRREIRKPARFVNHVEFQNGIKDRVHTTPQTTVWSSGEPSSQPRREQTICNADPPCQQLSNSGSWTCEEYQPSYIWGQQDVYGLQQDSGCWMSVEWGNFGPLDGQLIGTLVMSC